MRGVYLPGGRRVDIRDVPDPSPGPGQVVVEMRASTICGSDVRAIYREHLGRGAEAYLNVIAGHEPAGRIVAVGPGCVRAREGDRVALYHIAGCGVCMDCRAGYMIGCTSDARRAYGWQRDGGHADYLLAEEATCIWLPDELTYLDGACVACGFGTAYEALWRTGVSGRDSILVMGMGPVGMAAGALARAMGATKVIGADVEPARLEVARRLGAVDEMVDAREEAVEAILSLTHGHGCEVSIDCSGSTAGRAVMLRATRRWGRAVLVGEGNRLEIDVSETLIHPQMTLMGSWVTSTGRMTELAERLVRWDLHPERFVTDRFSLADTALAYEAADAGRSGKIGIVMQS